MYLRGSDTTCPDRGARSSDPVIYWLWDVWVTESQNYRITKPGWKRLLRSPCPNHQPSTTTTFTTKPCPQLTHLTMFLGMMTWTSHSENQLTNLTVHKTFFSQNSEGFRFSTETPECITCYSALNADKMSKYTSQDDTTKLDWVRSE